MSDDEQQGGPRPVTRAWFKWVVLGLFGALVLAIPAGSRLLGLAGGDGEGSGCDDGGEPGEVAYTSAQQALTSGGLGCFVDAADRDLPHFGGESNSMTPGLCIETCRGAGYRYAGLQYATQCYCGNAYGKHGSAPDSQCDMACNGNKEVRCGAGYRNNVYEVTPVVGAPAGDTIYHGCYVDAEDRDLPVNVLNDASMSPRMCVDACRAAGHRYAGVQYGQQCWCGDAYGKHGKAPGECQMACAGQPLAYCGAGWRSDIYEVLAPADAPLGCYVDAEDRDLDDFVTTSPRMNARLCRATCLAEGYRYASTQYGRECHCADAYGKHGQAPAGDCDVPCAGEPGEKCGGSWRNSVYATLEPVGCFVDSANRDLDEYLYRLDNLTPALCVGACRERGYAYAGVQDGGQCFCSQSYGAQGAAPEAECGSPCTGDAGQTCGGPYRNAVYRAAEYVGCFKDHEGATSAGTRVIRGSATDGDAMTVGHCIETCAAEGYPFAGLQYGKQCFCGDRFGDAGAAPEEECNFACAGNGAERCGASFRNSVYRVPNHGERGISETFRYAEGRWYDVPSPDFDSIAVNGTGDVVGMHRGRPYAIAWGGWLAEKWTAGGASAAKVDTGNIRWAVRDRQLWRWEWDAWQREDAGWPVVDVSVAQDGGVWMVEAGGGVFVRESEDTWGQRGGGLTRVSHEGGSVWAIDNVGHLRRYTGNQWEDHGGDFIDVAVGADGAIWRLRADGHAEYMSGTWGNWSWTDTGGGFTDLDVGTAGDVWAVNRRPDPVERAVAGSTLTPAQAAIENAEPIEDECDLSGSCPPDKPVYIAGLCYEGCPDGLTRTSLCGCTAGVLETDCGKYDGANSYDATRSCPGHLDHYGSGCFRKCPGGWHRSAVWTCDSGQPFQSRLADLFGNCPDNSWRKWWIFCEKGGVETDPWKYGEEHAEEVTCPQGGDLYLGRCRKDACPAGAERTAVCTCDGTRGGLDCDAYGSNPVIPDGVCVDAGTCAELFDMVPSIDAFDPNNVDVLGVEALGADFLVGVAGGFVCSLPNQMGRVGSGVPRQDAECGALGEPLRTGCDFAVTHAAALWESAGCIGQIVDAIATGDGGPDTQSVHFNPNKLSRNVGNVVGAFLAGRVVDKYLLKKQTAAQKLRTLYRLLRYLKRAEAVVFNVERLPAVVEAAAMCL